jgi:dTDP-4-dehydrorhamnose 3,5-epimerase
VIFTPTALPGVWVVAPEPVEDVRGFFVRTWCLREFADHDLDARWVQSSVSFNKKKGTLRGMHFQRAPYEEVKLVRCVRGALYDVVLDLRSESPSYKRHVAVELSADNRKAVYVPAGVAHGFQTLADDTEIFYEISVPYTPSHAAGVRWNDPAFGIAWPDRDPIISGRDRSYPDYHR